MTGLKLARFLPLPLLVLATALPAQQADPKPDVVIVITKKGPNAKYVEKSKYDKGDRKGKDPVEVKVGQTVQWKNTDTMAHTATSKYFDTKNIEADDGVSTLITFDRKMFEKAGGKPGGSVSINYHCTLHEPMKGVIKLVDGKK